MGGMLHIWSAYLFLYLTTQCTDQCLDTKIVRAREIPEHRDMGGTTKSIHIVLDI